MNRRSKLYKRTDGPGVRTWVGTRKARESTADGADGGMRQRAHTRKPGHGSRGRGLSAEPRDPQGPPASPGKGVRGQRGSRKRREGSRARSEKRSWDRPKPGDGTGRPGPTREQKT